MKSPKKLFGEYFRKRLIAGGKAIKGDEFEDLLASSAAEWENAPCDEYGGKTPREYVGGITDIGEMIKMFRDDVAEGGEPFALISDRLAEMPEAAPALGKIVAEEGDERLREAAADVLFKSDRVPVAEFAEVVFDPDVTVDLRERLIEILSQTENIYPVLAPRMEYAEGENALILAELLVSSGARGEDVFEFLMRLTESAETLPRALQLIAEYGDERALPRLYELSGTCDYALFTDIRSAVEWLGGEMDTERDWSADKTFAAIKGNGGKGK